MDGVLRGSAESGWRIVSSFTAYSEPQLIVNSYAVFGMRPARGGWGPAGEPRDGHEARYIRDSGHEFDGRRAVRWSVYCGNGAYLDIIAAETADQTIEDWPCPKVRKGVETRYRHGAWEKYTKRDGWAAV
jgi:hypothetical protein